MEKIKNFQKENNLKVDGVLGKVTLNKMKEVWKIKLDEQLANFIGQNAHETNNFLADEENLNYSKEGLLSVFPKYFNSSNAQDYAKNPQKIANRVYANRMGNGDEKSGDGWKHKGVGGLQITGADNYKKFSKWLGLTKTLTTSEIKDKYFWQTGLFYFEVNNLWELASKVDEKSITSLSKAINLGNKNSKNTPNGLQDRIDKTKYYFKLIKNT